MKLIINALGERFTILSLRGFPKFGTSKTLNLNGLAFFFMPNVPKLSDF